MAQPFIFIRYPLPGRRIRTATFPGVHLRSSIRLQEGVYGPEGPIVLLNSPIRRSDDAFGSRMVQAFVSSPICHQVAVSGSQMRSAVHQPPGIRFRTTRVFQPCTSLAYLPSERRIRTARGRAAHLYSPVCPQGDASGSRRRTPSSEDPTGRTTS